MSKMHGFKANFVRLNVLTDFACKNVINLKVIIGGVLVCWCYKFGYPNSSLICCNLDQVRPS